MGGANSTKDNNKSNFANDKKLASRQVKSSFNLQIFDFN